MTDTITIEVAAVHEIERGGGTFTADANKYPAEILTRIFHEGMKTVVGDTASGATAEAYGDGWAKLSKDDKAAWKAKNEAKVAEHANAAMEAKHKKLADGEWSMRGTGEGLTELDKEMVTLCRPKVKAILGDAKYKALGDEKDAEIVRYIESLDEKTRNGLATFAQSEIDRKAAAKARREALELPELDLEA